MWLQYICANSCTSICIFMCIVEYVLYKYTFLTVHTVYACLNVSNGAAFYKNSTFLYRFIIWDHFFYIHNVNNCFLSVVVITHPSHGWGRRFDPGRKHIIFLTLFFLAYKPLSLVVCSILSLVMLENCMTSYIFVWIFLHQLKM